MSSRRQVVISDYEEWGKLLRRWGLFVGVAGALAGASAAFLIENDFWPGVACGLAAAATWIGMVEWLRRSRARLSTSIES